MRARVAIWLKQILSRSNRQMPLEQINENILIVMLQQEICLNKSFYLIDGRQEKSKIFAVGHFGCFPSKVYYEKIKTDWCFPLKPYAFFSLRMYPGAGRIYEDTKHVKNVEKIADTLLFYFSKKKEAIFGHKMSSLSLPLSTSVTLTATN